MSKVHKVLVIVVGTLLAVGVGVYASFQLSPWPMVWLVRHTFDEGAKDAAASVAPHVPQGIVAQRGLTYATDDPDALFDVFAPASAQSPLPAVVWVHGGGFIAGTRTDLSDYLRVLSARGYVTVAIDYSVAPRRASQRQSADQRCAFAHPRQRQTIQYRSRPHFSGWRFSRRADRRADGAHYFRQRLRAAPGDYRWTGARVAPRAGTLLWSV